MISKDKNHEENYSKAHHNLISQNHDKEKKSSKQQILKNNGRCRETNI